MITHYILSLDASHREGSCKKEEKKFNSCHASCHIAAGDKAFTL